ncbi:hypothetical protein ACXYTP_21685 [Tsukamurella ocularis]
MSTIADPLHDYRTMSELVLAESRHDALRAAELRHQRRVDRARARLARAEGHVVVAGHARADAHAAVGRAMLASVDADRACARARLRVQQAVADLREVEAEEVLLPKDH